MTKYASYFKGVAVKKSYDKRTALSLAVACDLAYEDGNTVRHIATSWGFSDPHFFYIRKGRDIDTQGYVMANSTDVICVFRGSDTIEDWLANFQATYDPGPLDKTRVHEGFQDALFPAVINITNALDTQQSQSKRIWLTGHSLGGALCSLYAGMLIENGYSVYGIYNYASPRPGDDNYAVSLNKKLTKGPHYRVVNDGDIVPHVPPEPFYSHPGRRILINYNRRETSKTAWKKLRTKMFKVLMTLTGNPITIADYHRLGSSENSYIPRLIRDFNRG